MGVPNIGKFPTPKEQETPRAEVLGVVKSAVTDPTPQTAFGNSVDITEPPPPWEQEDNQFDMSDARRFVEVPKEWEIRWINPKLLEQLGWRDWSPVMASDERVKIKVPSMVSVEGNIRRGGPMGGDILAWMYRSWVISRRKQRQVQTERQTRSAVERQEVLREEFKAGKYGPYVHLAEAKHPTHTIGDGRSMTD